MRVNWEQIRFFKKSEFDCKCGCGRNEMQEDFLKKLDNMRARCTFPFIVTSGYRCPDHNESISSTGRTGPHTTGRAVDIHLFGEKAYAVLRLASEGRLFSGIGLKMHGPHNGRFMHLDDLEKGDSRFRPTVWTYK